MSAVGIIGGSGLYALDGLEEILEISAETPFGAPSGPLVRGMLGGREVYFLPRHGPGHSIAPHEINHRANIYALRARGVRHVISVAAVGSLREEFQPRDAVLPDQFFDRTSRRDQHTFFGGGIVAHISFADPTSPRLRGILADACAATGLTCHSSGTYVCIDGPAFSTRAESHAYRQLGCDIIGMTNLPEAKLAREAEIAYATLAMVTDYDAWRANTEAANVDDILAHLKANVEAARRLLPSAIAKIPVQAGDPEHSHLQKSILTPRSHWPKETAAKLAAIL
jgi:5'-methylthioadenosine phosphorylase